MKTSKLIIVFLCTVLCIYTQCMHTKADDTIKNWYLKYNQVGELPQTPDNGIYTEKFDVISLDKSGKKTIYLTFDAGYENGNVAKILDVLKCENVPGAFFLLPNIIKTNPELILRMKNEGHLICNHTKSHRNMAKITNIDDFKKELHDNEEILKNELNIEMSKYYRPPEGAYSELNLQFAKELGYKTVFWSLAYADWDNNKQPDKNKALSLLLSRIHPGCVMLLHPTSDTNAAIIRDLIINLKAQGYIFRSLEDFPSL